ncbi:MAG: hypothetical protein EOM91_17820 [Sphingobacteriia bacterium]|nr:hypothetical protein [Sphingobacteriia bacterium]NCC41353.1 hypothetical protein [Gammaproteobacteria bacterium]
MGERITRAEFARRIGVERSTITRWVESGRISLGEDGRLDYGQALRERDASESPLPKHQARKAQFDEARKAKAQASEADALAGRSAAPGADTAPAAAAEPSGILDVGAAMKLETWKLQRAKAELANLELDKAAGLLVERAEVEFVLADFGNTVRAIFEGLADRLTPALDGHQGNAASLHKIIDDVAREGLDTVADYLARRSSEADAEAAS